MHASRTRLMLAVLSLCAVALLISPASADPELIGEVVGGGDRWPAAASPAKAPTGVAVATLEWTTTEDADDGIRGVLVPPGRQALRAPRHTSALSPDARRRLDHEARCGPRVPVRRGAFPWPGWNDPRCRGGATHGAGADADADAGAPAVHRLQPLFDEP